MADCGAHLHAAASPSAAATAAAAAIERKQCTRHGLLRRLAGQPAGSGGLRRLLTTCRLSMSRHDQACPCRPGSPGYRLTRYQQSIHTSNTRATVNGVRIIESRRSHLPYKTQQRPPDRKIEMGYRYRRVRWLSVTPSSCTVL